jgi:pimeloyl-ACP methyl ester carboxylesterase
MTATTRSVATRPAPWRFAAPWGAHGYLSDLDGTGNSPVHWIEFDDTSPYGQTPIVYVHGLGGSHLNWGLVGAPLARGRRAVALDLHGFGLTPGTRANSSVKANQKLLDRFIRDVVGTPAILVGNSMGGLISMVQAAAVPSSVRALVLLNPALPLPARKPDPTVALQFLLYTVPGFGELYLSRVLARRSPELAVQQVIELCFADPSRADPEMITASVALAAHRLGERQGDRRLARASDQAFLSASRSLMRLVGLQRRYWDMMASIQVPVLLIGGDADRLVPVAAVRQAGARHPRWDTVVLAGVGHTPMLEVPDQVTGLVRDWLTENLPGA